MKSLKERVEDKMNKFELDKSEVKRRNKKHKVWMQVAHDISNLATCDRKHVGAVAVKDDRIVSHGYNGAPAGFDHCSDEGHLMHDGHCRRVVHSESNLVAYADRKDLIDSSIYITCSPCPVCFMLLANCGVSNIYYDEEYRPGDNIFEKMKEMADKNGIRLVKFSYLVGGQDG